MISKELEEQGCTCEHGYYCRYCRLLDKEDEQRKYDYKEQFGDPQHEGETHDDR